MIKLIVFDLDGVLIDSKELHYESLNLALKEIDEKYIISYDDHLKNYDGLPTNKKLEKLTKEKKFPENKYKETWEKKQKYTTEIISIKTIRNENLIQLFKKLKEDGFIIHVASNSIKKTIKLYLLKLDLIQYVDEYFSNEDVSHPKPHAEIYLKCMIKAGVNPDETLIIEDSHIGIISATKSGANILPVKNSKEVTIEKIYSKLTLIKSSITKIKWQGGDINILIPMAGLGSRFQKAGYTFPKPLIDVNGKSMIHTVVDNLNIVGKYIYVVQREHFDKYNLKNMLNFITPNCEIITIDSVTEGAACTTLLAEKFINNNQPLLIANSDQYIEWDSCEFMYFMNSGKVDGGILTFDNTHPKWSYVKTNDEGNVIELAEKKVISNIATVGIYYWNLGKEYVKFAKQMISKNIRVNNEFYVAPVYNEAIQEQKIIKIYNINKMWGLGTPEDLNYFLEKYNNDTLHRE